MAPTRTTHRPAAAKMPGNAANAANAGNAANLRPVPPISLRDSSDDLEVTAVDPRATAAAVMSMSIPDDGPTKPLALRIAVPRASRQGSSAGSSAPGDNVTMELTLLDVLPGVSPPPLPTSAPAAPQTAAEVEQVPELFPKLSPLTIARVNLVAFMLTLAAVPFFLAYSMAAAFRAFVAATPRMKELSAQAFHALKELSAQAFQALKELRVQAWDRMRTEWDRASRRVG